LQDFLALRVLVRRCMPGHVERGFMCRRWLCLAAATHERGEE
jgi:hypothetical protein